MSRISSLKYPLLMASGVVSFAALAYDAEVVPTSADGAYRIIWGAAASWTDSATGQ